VKRCRVCETDLPLADFEPRRAKCRPCRYAQGRTYSYTPEARSLRRVRGQKAYAQMAALLVGLKSKPCMDCGGTFPPYVMDFDHRDPSQKSRGVSQLTGSGWTAGLLAEIAKCDLVCANCHRIRTHNHQALKIWRRPRGRPRKM
jgi:hypothetical protein